MKTQQAGEGRWSIKELGGKTAAVYQKSRLMNNLKESRLGKKSSIVIIMEPQKTSPGMCV
jgi:flagellar biogenesis protein FliO